MGKGHGHDKGLSGYGYYTPEPYPSGQYPPPPGAYAPYQGYPQQGYPPAGYSPHHGYSPAGYPGPYGPHHSGYGSGGLGSMLAGGAAAAAAAYHASHRAPGGYYGHGHLGHGKFKHGKLGKYNKHGMFGVPGGKFKKWK